MYDARNWKHFSLEQKKEQLKATGYDLEGDNIICGKLVTQNLSGMWGYPVYDKIGAVYEAENDADIEDPFDHTPGLWATTFTWVKGLATLNPKKRIIKVKIPIDSCILSWEGHIKSKCLEVLEIDMVL